MNAGKGKCHAIHFFFLGMPSAVSVCVSKSVRRKGKKTRASTLLRPFSRSDDGTGLDAEGDFKKRNIVG